MPGKVVPMSGFGRFSGVEGAGAAANLTARQRRWLDVVASGGSLGDAATAAGVSERSGRRWKALPEIKSALRERGVEQVALGKAIFLAGFAKAARALVDMSGGDAEPNASRIAACRAVTDAAVYLGRDANIEERLDAIEAQGGQHEDR
jgi:phage terminase small subunit